ncbi:Alkaline phosphatase synthesis transcriptional regulatory protein PhoP [compost metagenome]
MSYRVLLVEDDPANAQIVQVSCERAGLEAHHVSTGLEALAYLAANPVDLILMDVSMPQMNGIEVTHQLRATPETAAIPIIFVTAMTSPQQLAELSVLQPAGIVLKPFSPRVLMAIVQETLKHPEERHTVIASPAQALGDSFDDLPGLSFIQEPGRMPGQQQELLAGVSVGGCDAGRQFGRGQGRSSGADVNPLLQAHQASL